MLNIPADSVLFERPVVFDVGSPGSFSIAYPSAVAGEKCYFGQSQGFSPTPSADGKYHLG